MASIVGVSAVQRKFSKKSGGSVSEKFFKKSDPPRAKVLDFLVKNQKDAVVSYLEHVISAWSENGSLFHNALVLQYKDIVVDLLDKQLCESEEERLELTKQKLKELLTTSTFYTAESVLQQFPTNCLFEERALLLGSLGRHMEALAIYLYQV